MRRIPERAKARAPALGVPGADLAIAAVLGIIQIAGTALATAHRHSHSSCLLGSNCAPPRHVDTFAFVLLAAGPITLAFRRRNPPAVLAGGVVAPVLCSRVGGYVG